MCFVSIHLAENHYYDILHYERNAFQPLWRDSDAQIPISLIVFKVFVVHFKHHMSQTFMSLCWISLSWPAGRFLRSAALAEREHFCSLRQGLPFLTQQKEWKRRKAPCICQTCSKRAPCTPQSASFIPFGRVRGQIWWRGEKQPLTVPAPQQTEEPKLALSVFSVPFFWCQVIQGTPRGPYEALWKGYCSGCLHNTAQKIKTLVMTLINALLWRPCFHMDHSCICTAPMPSHAALENKSKGN